MRPRRYQQQQPVLKFPRQSDFICTVAEQKHPATSRNNMELSDFIPKSEGYLSFWLIFVRLNHSETCYVTLTNAQLGLTSLFNTAQGHATTYYTRRIYNVRSNEVTPLSARTFGTWTALSGLVRLFAAYNIHDRVAYDLGLATFVIAWLHFAEELAIWGTAGLNGGVKEPVIVSSASVAWMVWARSAYLGG